ncbi:MAG TPA: DNA-processing protein DprA [Puia sp.]|nr:DNA-processing protein DprA [Puia sp.]
MENNALYQLALSRIRGIGPVYTKMLVKRFGDAPSVFRAGRQALEGSGLHSDQVESLLRFEPAGLRQELQHLQRIGVRMIFFTDRDYPRRLLPHPTAPALLFYQGAADLNTVKIIAVAGTRTPSLYGRQTTAQLIRALARPDLLIVSGLAFGIDATAHETALRCGIPTIGVLGHGMDHIYPALHRGLYYAVRRHGGIVTSFLHETRPDRYTFPFRNKLVAGLCDALIVIESGVRGGSMSAVEAAIKFQKKVFAVPGRITDEKSAGCLKLIQEQRALPVISADQLKAALGWECTGGHVSHQPALPFPLPAAPGKPEDDRGRNGGEEVRRMDPPGEEIDSVEPGEAEVGPEEVGRKVVGRGDAGPDISRQTLETLLIDLLRKERSLSFDDLITLTRQPIPSLSVALLNLEISGAIRTLPGRRYRPAG